MFEDVNPEKPAATKPKEAIRVDDVRVDRVTDRDKAKNKRLDLERCFKVCFNANHVCGAKEKSNPKEYVWFFQCPSRADCDLWLSTIKQEIEKTSMAKAATVAENVIVLRVTHSTDEPPAKVEKSVSNTRSDFSGELTLPVRKPRLAQSIYDKQSSDDALSEQKAELTGEKSVMARTDESMIGKSKEGSHESPSGTKGFRADSLEDLHAEREAEAGEEESIKKRLAEVAKYEQTLSTLKFKADTRAWDLKFQKYWGLLINADRNLDVNLKYSEKIIDHVGKFRRTATFYVKLIVEEMHKPMLKRKYQPMRVFDTSAQLYCDDDPNPLVYQINNILLKLTTREDVIVHRLGTEEFVESKWKLYARQFQSFDIMFDALYVLSKPKIDYNLRVPLCCVVDYKGFRALAIGRTPLNEELDPVLGLSTDGTYREATLEGVAKQIPHLAEVLNIKDHNFLFAKATQPTHVWLSPLVEVHRRDNGQQVLKDEPETIRLRKEHPDWDLHMYELDYDEDVYYILKPSELFPVDYYTKSEAMCGDLHLRPEYTCKFEKPLRADLMKKRIQLLSQQVEFESSEEAMQDLMLAKQQLATKVIPKLVEAFDYLNMMIIDSASLTQAFHSEGLNMRYLGVVAEQSILSHVKEVCVVEMLARSLKNILYENIAGRIFRASEDDEKKKARKAKKEYYLHRARRSIQGSADLEDVMVQGDLKAYYLTLLTGAMNGYVLDLIYDYMNLVFGKDPDTDDFWERVLIPYASQAFGYVPEKIVRSKLSLNALLFAFVYHMGIEMQIDEKLELGKSGAPFTNQIMAVNGKSKTYRLRNVPYCVLAGKYKDYVNQGKKELALKALKLKLAITKALDSKVDTTAVSEIAEILIEEGMAEKAIEQALYGVQQIHPLNAEVIKFYCHLIRCYYEKDNTQEADNCSTKAMAALQFHWGPYHPLHATIYSIMAYLMITHKEKLELAQQLYQASLICCARVLGPNHVRTAEIYMDIGRLYLRMNNKEQALSNIEKAYLIYESAMERCTIPLAEAAFQLATIMEDQRRFKDALPYARKASELYVMKKGTASEMCIFSLWMVVCIAYYTMVDDVVSGREIMGTSRCRRTAGRYWRA